jgi:hypothetical protein
MFYVSVRINAHVFFSRHSPTKSTLKKYFTA